MLRPPPPSPPQPPHPPHAPPFEKTFIVILSSVSKVHAALGVDISVYRAGFTQYTYSLRQGIQKLLEDRVNKILFSETGCTKLFEAGLTKYSLGQGLPKYLKKNLFVPRFPYSVPGFILYVHFLGQGLQKLLEGRAYKNPARTGLTKVARGQG